MTLSLYLSAYREAVLYGERMVWTWISCWWLVIDRCGLDRTVPLRRLVASVPIRGAMVPEGEALS